jgi:hypothetical protein
MHTRTAYIPALGFDRLTPLYDPFVRSIMRAGRQKHKPAGMKNS